MAFLTWSGDYLIGDATIDAEHCELFGLINAFHDHWMETRDRQTIARVLNRLVHYAEQHFQHEEAVMAAAGYPLLEAHHAVHEGLFRAIFRLHEEYSREAVALEMHTMKFVRNWLVEHIVENDYEFRDFLVRKAAEGKRAEAPVDPAVSAGGTSPTLSDE